MMGYLNREQANKEVFDHDGFVRTGDLGYYDDESGDVYYFDRMKEVIKYVRMLITFVGVFVLSDNINFLTKFQCCNQMQKILTHRYRNNHVAPTEIEDILQTHPAVAECLVFGKVCPQVQELISAVVVKRVGYQQVKFPLS